MEPSHVGGCLFDGGLCEDPPQMVLRALLHIGHVPELKLYPLFQKLPKVRRRREVRISEECIQRAIHFRQQILLPTLLGGFSRAGLDSYCMLWLY